MCSSLARVMHNIIKATGDRGEAVRVAVASLKAGKVIAVPTDTVYGLAASAQDHKAIEMLYQIKARDENKPLAVCLPEISEIGHWADISHIPKAMLNALLPGAVTLVLERRNSLNKELNPGNSRVGLRVPDDAFIRKIAQEFGGPIALTSANVSSEPSSLKITEFSQLWPLLEAIFDGGELAGSRKASTVVDLSIPYRYEILREGSALDRTLEIMKKFNFLSLR